MVNYCCREYTIMLKLPYCLKHSNHHHVFLFWNKFVFDLYGMENVPRFMCLYKLFSSVEPFIYFSHYQCCNVCEFVIHIRFMKDSQINFATAQQFFQCEMYQLNTHLWYPRQRCQLKLGPTSSVRARLVKLSRA